MEMIKTLRYKIRMFVIPIDGPASLFYGNEAVYKNTSIPASTLNKRVHHIAYYICREVVASNAIQIAKEGINTNLAYLFTKILSKLYQGAAWDNSLQVITSLMYSGSPYTS